MTMEKILLGRSGEDLATVYLQNRGFNILFRNLYTPYGEIDIVAEKDMEICFVEVKTRASDSYGLGREAVDAKKLNRIRRSAAWLVSEKKIKYKFISFKLVEISLECIDIY